MLFTKQELVLLHWLSKGLAPSEIASRMNISRNTLNAHRQSIHRKLVGTGVKLDDLKELSTGLLEDWIKA